MTNGTNEATLGSTKKWSEVLVPTTATKALTPPLLQSIHAAGARL